MQLTRTHNLVACRSRAAVLRGRWRQWYARTLLAMIYCVAVPGAAAEGAAPYAAIAPALTPALERAAAIRSSQAAVGRVIGDYVLRDREGRAVRLSSYLGKPLLVSFIYTGCFQVCPTTTRVLQKAVSVAQSALGEGRFHVISIGFNQPADSPQALKSFATQYGITLPNWEFLSPPAAIMPSLAHDFGFEFVATAAGFDHLLQVSVVDAAGRIYRQVYGDAYSEESLVEPLRQLITGTPNVDSGGLSGILDQVRILCSVYDPRTGQYRLSYGLVLEIAGGATFLVSIIWFFFNEWIVRRRSAKRSSA
jgi:protein SCO1/2